MKLHHAMPPRRTHIQTSSIIPSTYNRPSQCIPRTNPEDRAAKTYCVVLTNAPVAGSISVLRIPQSFPPISDFPQQSSLPLDSSLVALSQLSVSSRLASPHPHRNRAPGLAPTWYAVLASTVSSSQPSPAPKSSLPHVVAPAFCPLSFARLALDTTAEPARFIMDCLA
ncbi:hypothetical protein BGZ61DRAFT_168289 [Ilyonectria robusta]|uniref:uncharacterized protein n=1 Tax=Ilyonectria robusta TaxID=1079257 RepID=UPI001E8E83CC|nr:uncharacterized protein BGZ61DRAFT_168289 [Ilyonectria robusta]KAH8733940.1 hypothetical protein BGZ61DRAFT_168289 [Ilyonectria robusta]